MKNILIIAFGLFIFQVQAQEKSSNKIATSSFTVQGICDMCKERIERAAIYSKGVKQATWDKKSSVLTVIFNSEKTTSDAIELSIANAGHSTEHHPSDSAAYAKLPDCCAYNHKDAVKH